MNFEFSWEEYYENTFDHHNRTDFTNPDKYYISDITSSQGSRFIDFVQGATTSIKILLESSLFHSNNIGSAPTIDGKIGLGGNIYMRAQLDIVQNKICSYNCSSSDFGQHCYVATLSRYLLYKNYNYLSSYTSMGDPAAKGFAPICHGNGEVIINNANISDNRANAYCGSYIGDSYFPGNISQTSFINNSATIKTCVSFTGGNTFSFIKSNFLNNKVSDRLLQVSSPNISIIDSIIMNNIATNTFYTNGKVVYLIHSIVIIQG
ncbi:hypothetical protein TVAG_115710 [Trichomonas vaginalis G3]|uniref:Polymorphic repeat outer membrane protein n=1 Tax=Trichomonas vaginalis (strain ATCC PRA-98 / G3) TaxID=412133 RepID=A2EH44_TRIV3|nr:hypothetical protein TVAGG3_0439790 [Trichomonas vaginalis G3]EAY08012.1 hypothetical protein TVAG_115710 [Trichomonas vaginalis G3]KAI5537368.1 hypothetical protein TVAGG3_0439790 [Trichomonas vaginalis G3]|eukprot:XP_001320235.1 hypothetical protein [Trichomonas vaginalis G3]